MTVQAEAVKLQDVTGKDLYYIRLTNEQGQRHHVNVGEKTYEKLNEMQQDKSLAAKLTEAENKKRKELK